jgi:hypothetical protein
MKKILLLGAVAILLAFGLVLASCGEKCPGGASSGGRGNCWYNWSTLNYGKCTNSMSECMPGTASSCNC